MHCSYACSCTCTCTMSCGCPSTTYSYPTVIGVHEMHGQMHPNYWQITISLVVGLCSSLAYFMMTHPLPIAGKLPIKTLVDTQLPTNNNIMLPWGSCLSKLTGLLMTEIVIHVDSKGTHIIVFSTLVNNEVLMMYYCSYHSFHMKRMHV